jgi:hypothetical protein
MSRLSLSNACTRYGASMGRDSTSDRDLRMIDGEPVKLSLQRVALNSGGYDSGGAYWGQGEPLWRAAGDVDVVGLDGVTLFLRARDREHAKSLVRAKLRAARFYR